MTQEGVSVGKGRVNLCRDMISRVVSVNMITWHRSHLHCALKVANGAVMVLGQAEAVASHTPRGRVVGVRCHNLTQ